MDIPTHRPSIFLLFDILLFDYNRMITKYISELVTSPSCSLYRNKSDLLRSRIGNSMITPENSRDVER